jgi:NAD(P)-dependent dehydrogenase (short-subunit alcohol dehydrogenase family)
MLGDAGATVYCTGRGSVATPSASGARAGRPETIEETAALVDAAGGTGIPVRVDHGDAAEVKALVERVRAEQGRLDLLVNVLGGAQVSDWRPFHELPIEAGRALVDQWLWPHVITCRHAAPLLIETGSGLIVEIIEGETLGCRGQFYFDVAVTALKRLTYYLAEELAPHGVSALAVAPGFMRTEEILDHFGATEATWREVAASNAEARGFGFAGSETPQYIGRAIAALAADPNVGAKSGGIYSSWQLAEEYGFTDVDGARPNWGRYGVENFPHLFAARPNTGREWRIVDVGAAPSAQGA